MIVIRMARAGTNNKPFFHIVAAEARGPRDGKYLERIGTYVPKITDPAKKITLDVEAYKKWIAKGAQPSETIAKLVKYSKLTAN